MNTWNNLHTFLISKFILVIKPVDFVRFELNNDNKESLKSYLT